MGKKLTSTLAIGATGAVAVAAVTTIKKNIKKAELKKADDQMKNYDPGEKQVYLVGGGLASMAAAAYLIRDCNFQGKNIHIYEGVSQVGNSNNEIGAYDTGFVYRFESILNKENHENFWELFSTIPSLVETGKSVKEEIFDFNETKQTCSSPKIVDKNAMIINGKSMGFNNVDRKELGKLMMTPEDKLDDMTIGQWFAQTPHFFKTKFWYMWQTNFAFQRWSSLFELKRYMERMIIEFSRMESLDGVIMTPYNQYESIILPLKTFLSQKGVDFVNTCTVVDIDFKDDTNITTTVLHLDKNKTEEILNLKDDDLCIVTNGCAMDCSTLGSFSTHATMEPARPVSGQLWHRLAGKKLGFGDPTPFFSKPEETNLESFAITCNSNRLLQMIENISGDVSDSTALFTFKDSRWLLSIVIPTQPYFKNQGTNQTTILGYGLFTSENGDYVKKPMRDCTGEEILDELLYHLHLQEKSFEIKADIVNVIPCMMPYLGAQSQPRKKTDRPLVVPEHSTNFAMIGKFAEIPKNMVLTEEYSIKTARTAVYTLLGISTAKVCPVKQYMLNPKILVQALNKVYQ
jgi:oleate hydratase